jgi:HAD superfamily hydrolase (TIGR01490 family)
MDLTAQRQPDSQPRASRTSRILALFDFDGTLTEKDTLTEFISFFCRKENRKYLKSVFHIPMWLFNKLGVISNQRARRELIKIYFRGTSADLLCNIAEEFVAQKLPQLLNLKALEKLQWHREQGHEVVIVSATPSVWIRIWANELNIRVIATELEVNEGVYSGKFATRNCNGTEKVKRIRAALRLSEYNYIYAYGDSGGDKQMLNLADESYYRLFN